jgi:hypothetical protein
MTLRAVFRTIDLLLTILIFVIDIQAMTLRAVFRTTVPGTISINLHFRSFWPQTLLSIVTEKNFQVSDPLARDPGYQYSLDDDGRFLACEDCGKVRV